MKQETFETAQELNCRIEDLKNAIDNAETNKKNPCTGALPINFSFCYEDEIETLKKVVVSHLKARKLKLEKQFEALK